MQKIKRLVRFSFAAVCALTGFASAQTAGYQGVVILDQNWSNDERLEYYYTSQGSAALRYDIFTSLEQPGSEALFRTDENLARIGLVVQPSDPKFNPDGLPLGIAKAVVEKGRFKGEWVGLTCAACHSGELEYRGTKIRVLGGTNGRLDLPVFIGALSDALQATVADNAKFERMAARLGKQTPQEKEELRQELRVDADSVLLYKTRTSFGPTSVGPGRVDALALIHNQVMATQVGIPENWRPPSAPVKYSFVWNLPQSAWAQWSGTLPDPVLRNAGEVIGVFARSDLRSPTTSEGLFETTVDYRGLIRLEDLLRKLAPPQWPEDVLGRIDRAKAATGKNLFVENCSGCHSTWPHRWSEPRLEGRRFIENAIVGDKVVGTDPTQFGNPQFGSGPAFFPGALRPFLPQALADENLLPAGDLFGVLRTVFFPLGLDELKLTPEQRLSAHGYGPFFPDPQPPPPALFAYKANPAEGMWANPPFLHNGSVPNLYELLLPAAQRSKTFFIGRDFDPTRVGVDTSGETGKFLYDTSLIGNSNAGHSFENGAGQGIIGRALSDDERWAIIEYLKSIPDSPAQVTPFGGPASPIRAWLDPTFYHVRYPGTFEGAPTLR
jgi:hypothetical protein